ncbi:hypothetical protein [Synechococcus sp. PCC 6312]|uniref:hypothetical protein n=1 Tax=Synechococcus sp. (strain ATCC 27167 / PCC 6312) TaxID=195253 RepID=UPI00029F4C6B|nr:hypothetical protein [Synechococcus sp. PCC 6312]AFY61957.1 hypothetical protein Syn6312_2893 [Synechococcus sp. PCC 6312]
MRKAMIRDDKNGKRTVKVFDFSWNGLVKEWNELDRKFRKVRLKVEMGKNFKARRYSYAKTVEKMVWPVLVLTISCGFVAITENIQENQKVEQQQQR